MRAAVAAAPPRSPSRDQDRDSCRLVRAEVASRRDGDVVNPLRRKLARFRPAPFPDAAPLLPQQCLAEAASLVRGGAVAAAARGGPGGARRVTPPSRRDGARFPCSRIVGTRP